MITNNSKPLWITAVKTCLLTVLWSSIASTCNAQDQTELGNLFTEYVLPVLRDSCFECHSHEVGETNGGLALDSWKGIEQGGSRGQPIDMEEISASLLLAAIRYDDPELRMPPDGQLSEVKLKILEQWVLAGAPVSEEFRSANPVLSHTTSRAERLQHWAYQPVSRDQEFSVRPGDHNPIDSLLGKQLSQHSMQRSRRADRATLYQRLAYDLSGVFLSYDELQRLICDPREDNIVTMALIDRLLCSSHFGERWARYWMDVARYSDNKGYVFQEDREYAGAYKYRDWLINAFNQDMPYDEFVRQQLAADLLAAEGQTENLPALGFLTLGRRFLNNKNDIIDDRLDVVSRGLMGMTLACTLSRT